MDEATTFYTEGSVELLQARHRILSFSLARAKARIVAAKHDPSSDLQSQQLELRAKSLSLRASEIGDSRPLTGCVFSRAHHSLLATCGTSGITTLWFCTPPHKIERHAPCLCANIRCTDVAFAPSPPAHGNPLLLAVSYADGTAKLWNLGEDGTNVQLESVFEAHLGIAVARLAFHPCATYLATTSFDCTWQLWDVERGVKLLTQDGHSRSVYGISFQCDGSLAATCGLDALARVWDIRIGRSICALEGHVKAVHGIDFSPNGYHLATGSADQTCKIWDLRQRRLLHTIPAHFSLVSRVKYEPQQGHFLLTTSHDSTAKVWSGTDFSLIKVLKGHGGPVTGIDVSADGQAIATTSHDRNINLWAF